MWFRVERLTACSTSWGFESQVPRPIWGRAVLVDKVMILWKDMVVDGRGSSSSYFLNLYICYVIVRRRTAPEVVLSVIVRQLAICKGTMWKEAGNVSVFT